MSHFHQDNETQNHLSSTSETQRSGALLNGPWMPEKSRFPRFRSWDFSRRAVCVTLADRPDAERVAAAGGGGWPPRYRMSMLEGPPLLLSRTVRPQDTPYESQIRRRYSPEFSGSCFNHRHSGSTDRLRHLPSRFSCSPDPWWQYSTRTSGCLSTLAGDHYSTDTRSGRNILPEQTGEGVSGPKHSAAPSDAANSATA
jgi:hypothetical protein